MVNPQKIAASKTNTMVSTVFSVPSGSIRLPKTAIPKTSAADKNEEIMPLGIQFL